MKVLLIDDDELVCLVIRKQLSKYHKYEIWDTAGSGVQALEKLRAALSEGRDLPDLILLDLNMPQMNGWEFLDTLKQEDKLLAALPCICILSSSINKEDKTRSENYEIVNHFYSKPLLDEQIAGLDKICA